MKIVYTLSAVLFLLGCFAILVAVASAWAYLMVLAAAQNVLAGWILFVLSIVCWAWYQRALQAPWAAWFHVWQWADAELNRRIGSGSHG